MKYRALIFALAAVMACSCNFNNSDPILYRASMMGFLQEDGSLKGDDGRTYVFTNLESGVSWKGAERLMAIFDVTAELVAGERYSARILAYDFPLYKPISFAETPEAADALGNDPIYYEDGWYSGGCLNMINTFLHGNPDITHTVSLLVESLPTSSDTLAVSLKHDAKGDSGESAFTFYSSFPISEYLPEGKSTVLTIKWLWDDEVHTVSKTIKK